MLYIQNLSHDDHVRLEAIANGTPMDGDEEIPVYRAEIILQSASGMSVPKIALHHFVRLHPINVRKWIHRYSYGGVEALGSGKSPGRPPLFTQNQRRQIATIANTSPRQLGQNFSRWSLQRLRRYVIEQGVVEQISIETIRQIIQSNQD